jgi:hypothetical protein
MNFSEYTLVSFGDSFTAGDGLYDPSDIIRCLTSLDPELTSTPKSVKYFEYTRKSGYTSILSNLLNFKNYYNFGIEGASNHKILQLLEDWLYTKDDSNYFVIVSLTEIQRRLLYVDQTDPKTFNVFTHDMDFNSFSIDRLNELKKDNYKIADMSEKGLVEYYTYIETNTKLFYDFVDIFYSIKMALDYHNIPYIIFDTLSDIQKYGPRVKPVDVKRLPYEYNKATKGKHKTRYQPFLSGDVTSIDNYIPKSFYYNIVNKNYNPDKKIFSENHTANMFRTIDTIAFNTGNNYNSHLPNDRHWNLEGHMVCADILKEYILEKYT